MSGTMASRAGGTKPATRQRVLEALRKRCERGSAERQQVSYQLNGVRADERWRIILVRESDGTEIPTVLINGWGGPKEVKGGGMTVRVLEPYDDLTAALKRGMIEGQTLCVSPDPKKSTEGRARPVLKIVAVI